MKEQPLQIQRVQRLNVSGHGVIRTVPIPLPKQSAGLATLWVPDLAARWSPAPNPQKESLRTGSFGNLHWQKQIHNGKFLQTLGCPSPGLAPVEGGGKHV